MKPRNVILLLADQHNAKVLGCAGHPAVRTPHLDRMAREGAHCPLAVCPNPICTPSRLSIHSGQWAHNHGYYGLSGPAPAAGLPGLLGHLRERGWSTAALGKIHLPAGWLEAQSEVFHETAECSVGGTSPDYQAFLGQRYALEDHGGLPEFGPAGRQSMEGRPSPLSFAESQEGWIAAQAIAHIERCRAAGRPFAIHASFPRPHQCTSPSREFWDLYEGVDIPLPANADCDPRLAGKAPTQVRMHDHWRSAGWALFEPRTFAAARARKLRGYLAAISQVDAAVGLILDHLRRHGLEAETTVVYSADHGDFAAEHGIMEKAPGIGSDAITRVPLLWWGAGVAPGRTVEAGVHSCDIAPTLCAAAGAEPMPTADGADLGALLAGRSEASPHRLLVTENPWSRSVRRGRWRLVWYPRALFAAEHPAGFGELYDLAEDPWEMRNRWHDPECRGLVAELERELLEWLVTTTRPVTAHACSTHRRLFSPQARQAHHCWAEADGKVPPAAVHHDPERKYL